MKVSGQLMMKKSFFSNLKSSLFMVNMVLQISQVELSTKIEILGLSMLIAVKKIKEKMIALVAQKSLLTWVNQILPPWVFHHSLPNLELFMMSLLIFMHWMLQQRLPNHILCHGFIGNISILKISQLQ